MQKVHEILARDNPAVFSPDIDTRIRAEFKDLVAGNAAVLQSLPKMIST
jgi:hypothetical protein